MAVPQLDAQTVERFHLVFLTHLGAALDKGLYAIKGGCNLRFFFKSVRYSEDLDFDVHTVAQQTLRKNVDRVLASVGLRRVLAAMEMEMRSLSHPKQTGTTQRWKLHLRTAGGELPTRIEFSRRRFDLGVVFEPVDPEVTQTYKLKTILTSHYDLESAFAQKVEALALRPQTQARDLFDLALLCDNGAKGSRVRRDKMATACENALSVSYDQFKSQVVAFLENQYQEYYRSPKAWATLQEKVLAILKCP